MGTKSKQNLLLTKEQVSEQLLQQFMLLPLMLEIVLEIGEGDFALHLIPISASGLDEHITLPVEHV